MAHITPGTVPTDDWVAQHGVKIYQWKDVGPGDTCVPADISIQSHVSVQINGVLDGASVAIDGAMADDLPWAPLHDDKGNEIAIGSYPTGYDSVLETIKDAARKVKPSLSGGGTPKVTITILARK